MLSESIRIWSQRLEEEFVVPKHIVKKVLADPMVCANEVGSFDFFLDENEYKRVKSLMLGVKWEQIDCVQFAGVLSMLANFPAVYLNSCARLYYFPVFSLAALCNPGFAVDYLKFYASHFVRFFDNSNAFFRKDEFLKSRDSVHDVMIDVLCKIEFSAWDSNEWRAEIVQFNFAEFLPKDFFQFCSDVERFLNDCRYTPSRLNFLSSKNET